MRLPLVIDASVAAKWFLAETGHVQALALLKEGTRLEAPDLIVAEVANIAWKKHRLGEMRRAQAEAAVAALPHYFGQLWPSRDLAERALGFALALDHPAYDGFYLACAEAAGGTLVTADARLIKAVEPHSPGLVCPLDQAT